MQRSTFPPSSLLLLVQLVCLWPSAPAAGASPSAAAFGTTAQQLLPLRTIPMSEETPAGTPLANAAKDFVALLAANLSSGGQSAEEPLRFALLPGSSAQEFVTVNASTGALVVARPFDREAACATLRICCPAAAFGVGNGNNGAGRGQSQAQLLVGAASAAAPDGRSNCSLELTVRASRDTRYVLLDYRINGVLWWWLCPLICHLFSVFPATFRPVARVPCTVETRALIRL